MARVLTVAEISALPEGTVVWGEFWSKENRRWHDIIPAMRWGYESLINGGGQYTSANKYGTIPRPIGRSLRWWSEKPTDKEMRETKWDNKASKEKDIVKLYGGYIDVDRINDASNELDFCGEVIIVKKLIELGLLKVQKEQGLMITRYNWAIKAVKWDD